MRKRLIFALLTVGLLWGIAIPAYAVQTGSIRVTPETKPPAGSAVTLHHAGAPAEGGYWLDEVYGGGLVRWGDLPSEALALWLAEHVAAEGTTVSFDADGSARFSDLTPGLYFVKQTGILTGAEVMTPFVIEVPYEDIWEISVRPQAKSAVQEPPPTGQSLTPLAAAAVMAVSGFGLLRMAVRPKRKRAAEGKNRIFPPFSK